MLFRIIASSPAGIPAAKPDADGGCSWRCLMAMATGVSPSNGTLPVNISKSRTPSE